MSHEEDYAKRLTRIRRMIVGLGIAGTVFVTIYYGWQTGLGFLVGAIASYLSLSRWHRVVQAIGAERGPRMPVAGFIVQFALVAITGYAIVKYLSVNRLAAFSGLLVGAAAVTLELVYELVYGE